MQQMLKIAGGIMCAVLVLAGCGGGQEKKNLEQFNQAQKLFETVEGLVRQGRLDEAHDAYSRALDSLSEIRRRSGPARMGDYDLPPGPALKGLTAQKWQEIWAEDMRVLFKSNFNAFVKQTAAGKLDWTKVRSYINTYAPELDQEWVAAAQDVDSARTRREGDAYAFLCESQEMNNCDAVFKMLSPLMAKPLSQQAFVTDEGRRAAFGTLQISIQLDKWQKYGKPDAASPAGGVEYFSIPGQAVAMITVTTNKGRSSWDGRRDVRVETELPANISSYGSDSTVKQYIQILQQKLEQQLGQLEKQTLAPGPPPQDQAQQPQPDPGAAQ